MRIRRITRKWYYIGLIIEVPQRDSQLESPIVWARHRVNAYLLLIFGGRDELGFW